MSDRSLARRSVAGPSRAIVAARLVSVDRRASVAILIAVSALLWLPSLAAPLDIDDAGYAIAAYWWVRGDTLCQTLTITRPQGIFVVYRLIEAVGLGSVRGLHLAAGLYAMLCTLVLDAVVRRVWGAGVGFAAALLFAALLATPVTGGYSANAELFTLLPLLGGLYLLVRADADALDQPGTVGMAPSVPCWTPTTSTRLRSTGGCVTLPACGAGARLVDGVPL